MNFSQRLIKLMKDKGITAYKLSMDIPQISEAMIGKWKNAKSLPSFENIIILANYFLVTTDFLLTGKDISSVDDAFTSDELEFLNRYKDLDFDGKLNIGIALRQEEDRMHLTGDRAKQA